MTVQRIPLSQTGFSFMEVCCAIGIFGLCLFMYVHMTVYGVRGSASAEFRTRGSLVAESLMEELLSGTSMNSRLSPGVHTALYDRTGRLVSNDGFFTAIWTVTNDKPLEGVFEIEVVVNWMEEAKARRLRLVTNRRAL